MESAHTCLTFQAASAVGETKEVVLRLLGEAVELHLEALREDGLPIPEPSSSSEYVEVGAA